MENVWFDVMPDGSVQMCSFNRVDVRQANLHGIYVMTIGIIHLNDAE